MDYKKAKKISNEIRSQISDLTEVGSLARKENKINDFDYITMRNIEDVVDDIHKLDKSKLKKIFGNQEVEIDLWKADNPDEFMHLQVMRTINKGKNIYYRKLARSNGYTLTDKYLKIDGKKYYVASEEQLMIYLNLI